MTEIQRIRNRNRQGISQSNRTGLHDGCVRFGKGERLTHIFAKLLIARACKKSDNEVFTESIFNNGCRADVFVSDDNTVIEVLDSETLEDCANKLCRYPEGVTAIVKTAKYWIDKYAGIGVYELLKNQEE